MSASMPKVLGVASAGGHWTQLLRLRPALEGCAVTWLTTNKGFHSDVGEQPFFAVRDANRWNKMGLLVQLLQVAWIVVRVRPDVVITTGASPGFFAVRVGSLLGSRTVWVDSIANADELSMSGRKAGRYVSLWLTQWEHLAAPQGPEFRGAVL